MAVLGCINMSDDRIEGAAREGLGRMQDAVGGLVGDYGLQAKGKLNEAAGSVQNAYGKARDRADDAVHDARDQVLVVYDDLQQYIRDNPLLAVGLGVLAGVVLWSLAGGGRRTVYIRK
jgi:uncharacterized protein YjbJ (UPF0337 family)